MPYDYTTAEITLRIEVRRHRSSVTQGSASVYINGEKLITFHDEIELIKRGEAYYGDMIDAWASRKPDAGFILGLLFHPHDVVYHYSDSVKHVINQLCEAYPATVREGEDHHE